MPYAHGGLCPMPSRTSYESSKGYIFTPSILPLLLLGAIHTVLLPKIV